MKKWTAYKASVDEDAECYDILEQNEKLKEENRKLKLKIGELEFYNLSEEEREWAENTFTMLTWHGIFSKEMRQFYWDYIKYKEDLEKKSSTDLPF